MDKEKEKTINNKNLKTKNKVRNKEKVKTNRKTVSMQKFVLVVSIVFALCVFMILFVNLVAREDTIFNIDCTYSQIFRLTQESKNIIKHIEEPIEISIDSSLQYTQVTEVLKEIAKLNRLITIVETITDPETEAEEQLFYSTIIVKATNKEGAYSAFDLNFDANLIDDKTYKQYSLLEEKLINAIISVTKGESPEEPSIAFLTGLEESELNEELRNLYAELRFSGIQSIVLDLKKTKIPESVQTIAIIGPMQDINQTEYNKLIEFQAKGGNFVIAVTFVQENSHPLLDKFLSSYGVNIPVGAVIDYKDGYRYSVMQNIEVMRNYNNILLPIPTTDNMITKDMVFEGTAPFFIFPTKIDFEIEDKLKEKNITHTNHILTSDMAVFKKDDIVESDVTAEDMPPNVIPSIYVLGTIAEKQMSDTVNSTAIIYSNYLFMTDLTIPGLTESEIILQKDNLRLAKNTFTYLNALEKEKIEVKKGLIISPYKYDKETIVMHKIVTYLLYIISIFAVITVGVITLYKRGYLLKYDFFCKEKVVKNNKRY